MGDLLLVKPCKSMEEDVLAYKKEYFDHGEKHIHGSAGLARCDNYDIWLQKVQSYEKDDFIMDYVNASTYFSVRKSDNKVIGTVQLRHSLSEELRKYGGHIGYGIRPSERLKGYAGEQLSLVMEEARKIGLRRVMITCDKDNLASAKVIQNNGGELEWEGIYEPTNEVIQIYWISL